MTKASGLYQTLAATLIEEHGWDHAVLIATAVRGYVYGQPNPGPHRDAAEKLYGQLGWEQAALLAAWFRDSHNWPTNHPSTPQPRPAPTPPHRNPVRGETP